MGLARSGWREESCRSPTAESCSSVSPERECMLRGWWVGGPSPLSTIGSTRVGSSAQTWAAWNVRATNHHTGSEVLAPVLMRPRVG